MMIMLELLWLKPIHMNLLNKHFQFLLIGEPQATSVQSEIKSHVVHAMLSLLSPH